MRSQGDAAEILEFGVAPAQQDQGLGRRIVGWLAEEAKRRGKRQITVGTGNSSLGYIAFYQTQVASRLEFQFADALRPALLQRPFGAVVDSGFFHLFNPKVGDRFIAERAATLLPGDRYYLLAFAVEFAISNAPRAVSAEEIQARFTPAKGWRIQALRKATFQNRVAAVPATCACLERLPAPSS